MSGVLKLKYKEGLRECAALMLKRGKAGKEAEKVGEFMAEFNLVVELLSLLSCITGI